MRGRRGEHNATLHVLVAAVTAAERKRPMPTTEALAAEIGCVRHGVSMALAYLERVGVIKRLNGPEARGRVRVMICATGAATGEHV